MGGGVDMPRGGGRGDAAAGTWIVRVEAATAEKGDARLCGGEAGRGDAATGTWIFRVAVKA